MNQDEYHQQAALLLSTIPEEFHSALSWYAYDQGHAYGYSEVLSHLSNLVSMLADPIQHYTQRITK